MNADRPTVTPELSAEAVAQAKQMAKAAGPQTARVLAEACYMLICAASMVSDPEGYLDWLAKRDDAAPQEPKP